MLTTRWGNEKGIKIVSDVNIKAAASGDRAYNDERYKLDLEIQPQGFNITWSK